MRAFLSLPIYSHQRDFFKPLNVEINPWYVSAVHFQFDAVFHNVQDQK